LIWIWSSLISSAVSFFSHRLPVKYPFYFFIVKAECVSCVRKVLFFFSNYFLIFQLCCLWDRVAYTHFYDVKLLHLELYLMHYHVGSILADICCHILKHYGFAFRSHRELTVVLHENAMSLYYVDWWLLVLMLVKNAQQNATRNVVKIESDCEFKCWAWLTFISLNGTRLKWIF
jgi:hypothetical protein